MCANAEGLNLAAKSTINQGAGPSVIWNFVTWFSMNEPLAKYISVNCSASHKKALREIYTLGYQSIHFGHPPRCRKFKENWTYSTLHSSLFPHLTAQLLWTGGWCHFHSMFQSFFLSLSIFTKMSFLRVSFSLILLLSSSLSCSFLLFLPINNDINYHLAWVA